MAANVLFCQPVRFTDKNVSFAFNNNISHNRKLTDLNLSLLKIFKCASLFFQCFRMDETIEIHITVRFLSKMHRKLSVLSKNAVFFFSVPLDYCELQQKSIVIESLLHMFFFLLFVIFTVCLRILHNSKQVLFINTNIKQIVLCFKIKHFCVTKTFYFQGGALSH